MKKGVISIFLFFFCFSLIKAQIKINDRMSKEIGKVTAKPLARFANFPTYEKEIRNSSDGTKTKVKYYFTENSNPGIISTKSRSKDPKVKQNVVSTEKGNGWVCQTSNVKISLEDDSFMNAYKVEKSRNLIPGTVYTFENFYEGKFNEERSLRNPIRITSYDIGINGDISETVENPSKDDNRNAWNKIFNRTAINKSNGGYNSKLYITTSESEMMTSVGFSAAGYGAEIKMGFDRKATEYERYFIIDATQEMYAATAELPKEGVFKNPEDNKKTGLMFLQSVVYGMRALVSVKMSFKSQEAANELSASYKGFGFGASADLKTLDKYLNSSTEIKMYIIGGENQGYVTDNIQSVQQVLNAAFKNLNNKNAAPLYFTFVNMNNEAIRTSSATDDFTTRQCIPVPPDAPDENLRYYDVSVTLDQIEEKNKPNDEKSIGFRIDAGLYLNNEQIQFANQNKKKFYDPLLYVGDRENLNPKEMTKKWGKPDNGKLNFYSQVYPDYRSGYSFSTKLTRGQIIDQNALIKINIPVLADYMGADDWQFYDKIFKDILLKDIINSSSQTVKININHNDGKSYTFSFTIKAEQTTDYAAPPENPKTTLEKAVERHGGEKIINKKLKDTNVIRKTNK